MSDRPALTSDHFRHVMSRFATGVTVMSVDVPDSATEDGLVHGMTANAVTSVSLDPLLVLVCVVKGSGMDTLVRRAGHFALSFLRADQTDLSDHFADPDRPFGVAQFEGLAYVTCATGAPVLADALGWLDCTVWAVYDGGDHDIVIGEVVAADIGDDGPALGWYGSGYTKVELP